MGLFDDHEVVIDHDASPLHIVIRRKPLFVREATGPWHCLSSPGSRQTRCHVLFDPKYHPDKVALYPDREGIPGEPRCARNGCRQQFEVLDAFAARIAEVKAEIERVVPNPFPFRRTYEGRASGCPYCGSALPADDHPTSTYGENPAMPIMVCPAVPEGKIALMPRLGL